MTAPATQSREPSKSTDSLQFVILAHDWPSLHWDILLQSGNRLMGWRGDSSGHFLDGGLIVQSDDHRLEYLDYEGAVSGNRGVVHRLDRGELAWIETGPNRLAARISGKVWKGILRLTKETAGNWFATLDRAD